MVACVCVFLEGHARHRPERCGAWQLGRAALHARERESVLCCVLPAPGLRVWSGGGERGVGRDDRTASPLPGTRGRQREPPSF